MRVLENYFKQLNVKIPSDPNKKFILFPTSYAIYKLVHSGSTIAVDLDRFEKGEVDKLFICGIAGAGKTELGKKLSQIYKCKYINLDKLWTTIIDKQDFDMSTENLDMGEIQLINQKIVEHALKIISNKRCIIEGVPLFLGPRSYNEKILRNDSVIFIGSSIIGAGLNLIYKEIGLKLPTSKVIKNIFLRNPKWIRDLDHHRSLRASYPGATIIKLDTKFVKKYSPI